MLSREQEAVADVLGTVAIGAAIVGGILYLITGRASLALSIGLAVGTTIAVVQEQGNP